MRPFSVDDLKRKCPMPELMKKLGLGQHAKPSASSPFREDKHPSWGIFRRGGGWFYKDHATGESGDEFRLLARVCNLDPRSDFSELVKRYAEIAGVSLRGSSLLSSRPASLNWPPLRLGSAEELDALSTLRNVSRDGIELASDRGLLLFSEVKGHPAWVVTDRERVNAQARRLDGGAWDHIGGKKTHTLPGSRGNWPLGINEAGQFPCVALVEGGADLLAAFHFIYCEGREQDCSVVAMLGAGMNIQTDDAAALAGSTVRIFPDADRAGVEAAVRWERKLREGGAMVDCFQMAGLQKVNGDPVKDLNDLCFLDADQFENDRELWSIMPERKEVDDE